MYVSVVEKHIFCIESDFKQFHDQNMWLKFYNTYIWARQVVFIIWLIFYFLYFGWVYSSVVI